MSELPKGQCSARQGQSQKRHTSDVPPNGKISEWTWSIVSCGRQIFLGRSNPTNKQVPTPATDPEGYHCQWYRKPSIDLGDPGLLHYPNPGAFKWSANVTNPSQ